MADMRSRPRQAGAQAHYRKAAAAVAAEIGVDLADVLSTRRRKGAVAEARQLAAYLAVTGFELSRRQVARLTGVHFTAVCRWCTSIEEDREDPSFDQRLGRIEARLW